MRVFNTQTRQKEELVPMEPGHFKIYVCGPTVYNYFHLGNARPFITYDTLRRYLEYRGNKVSYVQNFTDIDDKMIRRANDEGITVRQLADRFIEEYFKDADKLGIKRATVHPRATDCIDEMVDMIKTLKEKDFAYVGDDGVYFDMSKFEGYGKLSHHNLEELEAGASDRLQGDGGKRNPMDFALWKFRKPDEPFWPSPWGEGRPGWHIECSAMVRKYLGVTIDVHGGGQDLIFPHHENEIAQSEAANGKPFVNYWLHNGFINVDQEKMSKSTGNFFTVRDLVTEFDYQVLRFFMLSGHYRMPINFSSELLTAAQNGWERIKTCVEHLAFVAQSAPVQAAGNDAVHAEKALKSAIEQYQQEFVEAMDDDLNTADALAAIFEMVRAANSAAAVSGVSVGILKDAAGRLREWLDVLGLNPDSDKSEIPQEIMDLVGARVKAKQKRDFARADQLRQAIQDKGYQVTDTPQGPKVTAS